MIAIVFGGKTSKTRDRQVARLLDRGFSTLNNVVVASGKHKVLAYASGRPKKTGTSSVWPKYRSVGKAKRSSSGKTTTRLLAASGRVQSWAIQVGAYNRYGPAHLAVNRAARALPSLLGNKFRIVRQKSGVRRGLQIYKARLLVPSESKARNSCKALKRRKIDCMVIWMGPRS